MAKAIETRYKGFRFRSRTEARWAVFFDAMGYEWQYELEGYELSEGWYLPDFWLPQFNVFAEVKGVEFTEHEDELAWSLADEVAPVLKLVGPPECKPYRGWEDWEGVVVGNSEDEDGEEILLTEPIESVFAFGIDVRHVEKSGPGHSMFGDFLYSWTEFPGFPFSDKCRRAVASARSARFEHGESPR